MSIKKHREVNQKEFLIFVDDKNLETNVCGIVEPIQVQFNDFSSGKIWPESVVAYFYDDYLDDNKRHYFILEREYRESKSCEMPVKEFSPQDVILNINGVKCVDYLIQD